MQMEIVECTSEYWEFVRLLRTDPKTVPGFVEEVDITPEDQIKYMNKYSGNYRIALLGSVPAGFVGSINGDIRVCTHPDYQGKGLGKFMINKAMDIWPDSFAKVKVDNKASLKLFETCGFSRKFVILEKNG